jgi:hypothetical protein
LNGRPHVGAALAGWLWSLTSVFDGYLAVVGSGGALIVDQSTVWWSNRRFGLMRSERYKYSQRDHCARRNQKDCVLWHPANMRPESDFPTRARLQQNVNQRANH